MGENNSMASKRSAKKQLTHDNWEEEDVKEEAGVFKKADSEVIGKRIIKKAVRRVNDSSFSEDRPNAGKLPFSNFSLTSKSFSFTNTKKMSTNGTIDDSSVSNQNGINSSKIENTKVNSFKITPFVVNGQITSTPPSTSFAVIGCTPSSTKSSHSSEYYKQLAALNQSVSNWIKQHVDKNQYCILTPIFKDYETHLKDIEKLSPENSPEEKLSCENSSEEKLSGENSPENPKNDVISFNDETLKKKSMPATPFFAETASFATFSFANSNKKLFSFTASSTDCKTSNDESADSNNKEDSDDVPPVPEVITFQEEGSVYSMKCKLFYKKNDSYIEKGTGTLFIKIINDKTQLLVRTNTALGLILLNIMLTKNIPCSRLGKNNVSMLCVLNPPLESNEEDANKPVSILIRVKTAEDADILLSKLNENKV